MSEIKITLNDVKEFVYKDIEIIDVHGTKHIVSGCVQNIRGNFVLFSHSVLPFDNLDHDVG